MALTGGEVRLAHQREGAVAVLTLSRPGKMNAVTFEMRERLNEHFVAIDKDPQVRVVVIRGEGEVFTAGGDIEGFLEVDPPHFTDLGHDLTAPSRSPKPVIAAVDGLCLGAGLELAMSCDIRLATRRSEFGQPEMRLGMIPGSGGTQRLARLVGLSRAKYLVMTGERFSAENALAWGVVAKVAEDAAGLEAVMDRLVGTLLGYSPLALRTAKEVLDRGSDGPLASGIELERKAYAMLRASHDFTEGVNAFLERRTPHFEGR
ncbi:MAG: enoyl-CoA hydratase/isomerase family protein [Acidimicrobiia bacterium]